MKKKAKLTPKQGKFVKEYIKTGNATKSAEKAGYKGNKETLRVVGSENLTKPSIQSKILLAHEKAGITDELLAQKLKEGLSSGKTLFFQKDGRVISKRNCIDYQTRQRYIETAHKLRGDFAPQVIDLQSEDINKLTDSLKKIAEGK